ncbi:ABC transporter ATP-binding protein [Natrinema halophilum]|uniref:ABC transporter ATP-binding protein n=1 Tax=Natrinema halophilum TaxID=1699371 RepID=UPI001F22F7F0|nr:ABC transporter ATP-binding protein [Natrinema halophilum]UHQ96284.1 ABC transporter ATP-binding protein [Natrinema halophilum]
MTELLELQDVGKKFGDFIAVDKVTIDVNDGEITALIGPNGAGKTTLYNMITGRLTPTSGSILFRDEDLTSMPPALRTRKGLGRSFQITNIFTELTVRENLQAPVIARTSDRFKFYQSTESNPELKEETDRLLDLVNLHDVADKECDTLAYGERRRVELGIALGTDPQLLLLDEPTAGMNPKGTQEMVDLIDQIDDETDTTFMITEHDMNVVFTIADRILVLNNGSIIADGTPKAIQEDSTVQTAYLGGEV